MELTELNLSTEQMEGVNSYIQSEGDKIRTKYNKQIKELESKLPVEQTEEQKTYAEKLKALEDKELELNKKESLSNLQKQLSDKGLNSELAQYLNVGEGVEIETYIDNLTKIVGTTTNTFKPNSHAPSGGITKEKFNAMTYTERTNLYNTNKSEYDILSK